MTTRRPSASALVSRAVAAASWAAVGVGRQDLPDRLAQPEQRGVF